MTQPSNLVVITGVSGHVGMGVTARLCDAGYRVIGLDSSEPAVKHPQAKYMIVDFSSDESVRNIFQQIKQAYGNRMSSIIHLADYVSVTLKDSPLYDKITVQGTGRVLRAVHQFNCEQFLYGSTLFVHAPCVIGTKITENSPVLGDWGYPESKIKAEDLLHENHRNIPLMIFRTAGTYDDKCHSMSIAHQIQRIYERQLFSRIFPGHLNQGRPYLHLSDLSDAVLLAVQKRAELPSKSTLIISEDETMSYEELQQEISKLIWKTSTQTYAIPKWFAAGGTWAMNTFPFMPRTSIKPWMIEVADQHYEVDISKAEKELGWYPQHFLRDTLPKMIDFLKSDTEGFYQENNLEIPNWLQKRLVKVNGSCKPSCGCK